MLFSSVEELVGGGSAVRSTFSGKSAREKKEIFPHLKLACG